MRRTTTILCRKKIKIVFCVFNNENHYSSGLTFFFFKENFFYNLLQTIIKTLADVFSCGFTCLASDRTILIKNIIKLRDAKINKSPDKVSSVFLHWTKYRVFKVIGKCILILFVPPMEMTNSKYQSQILNNYPAKSRGISPDT